MPRIDIKPISANQCWQGRRFKTPEYKIWRLSVGILMKKHKRFSQGKYEVNLRVYTRYCATSDVDNFIKPALDSLVESGIIPDDKYIQKVTCEKFKSDTDYFEYEIKEL